MKTIHFLPVVLMTTLCLISCDKETTEETAVTYVEAYPESHRTECGNIHAVSLHFYESDSVITYHGEAEVRASGEACHVLENANAKMLHMDFHQIQEGSVYVQVTDYETGEQLEERTFLQSENIGPKSIMKGTNSKKIKVYLKFDNYYSEGGLEVALFGH